MSENTFSFSLVSPEKVLFNEQVKMVTVPGSEGEFGVLPNHAPLLSSLQEGVVSIVTEAGEVERIFVAGGFADMNENICTILVEDAINIADINRADLEKEKEALHEKLNMLADGEDVIESKQNILQDITVVERKLALIA